jgi:hypothetical protein
MEKILLIVVCMLLAMYSSAAVFSSGKNYSMVLVGGGLYDNNTEVWETIIKLGGGEGKARFGVVAAASEVWCNKKVPLLGVYFVFCYLMFLLL